MKTKKWYSKSTGSADQAIIADEETGRSIAVVYDEADGSLLAAAPDLLEACKVVDKWLQENTQASNRPAKLDKLLIAAIAKAENGD